MHTMHIGIFHYAWGSVLWLLVYELLPDTPQANMRTVMFQLREFWAAHPTPGHFAGIRLQMFSKTNDPEGQQGTRW